MTIKKKTVLVTGSTSGIGLGIAESFIKENYTVLFTGRNDDKLEELSSLYKEHFFFKGDLLEKDSLIELEKFIDENSILLSAIVLNIGSGRSVPPGEEFREEWDRIFEINFFGATLVTEQFKRHIISNTTNLVFVSSICGLESLGAPLTYSCAKSALNSYVVGLSQAWGKHGVRVNAVAPGNILFPGSVWDQKMNEDKDAVLNMLKKEVPLQKLGSPQDVGNAVLFLADDQNNFITGAVLAVDGGQTRSY